ncbi:hypothetical protein [Streptomyces capoamus]|uniref:hypothetical protein n=1 Tax=Streptomyces capoamus TaxID=68183 RepID=UPI00167498DC|nr:hypothetical protein [Streptomyces capoamus]GGP32345.1 hypothetical protein GCM10010501_74710 [Streptomyces libani subsp. rufus]
MALSLSAAVLLGIIVAVLLKGGHVRFGSMLACTLFGFTLAATGLAPAINSGLASIAGLLSSL